MSPRIVELRRDVLDRNNRRATALRADFAAHSTCVVNLVSSPGTGKTSLLTAVLRDMISRGLRPAALVGDCATDNDARRLATSGAPVRQIVTEGMCHLEADMIAAHLHGWDLDEIDHLFIENVGNLVCPAAYDLGETVRVALLSVTEGEDKPTKYPQMFNSADLIVITKLDLAAPCEFDLAAARANIDRVHPGVPLLLTSSKDAGSVASLVDTFVDIRARMRRTIAT